VPTVYDALSLRWGRRGGRPVTCMFLLDGPRQEVCGSIRLEMPPGAPPDLRCPLPPSPAPWHPPLGPLLSGNLSTSSPVRELCKRRPLSPRHACVPRLLPTCPHLVHRQRHVVRSEAGPVAGS